MLDEAHSIKDRNCSTAKAVFALDSKYKLCLTGTPLQNRVGECTSCPRHFGLSTHASACRTAYSMIRPSQGHKSRYINSPSESNRLHAASSLVRLLSTRPKACCPAGELYSLVRFLRVFPWAYYFCKVIPIMPFLLLPNQAPKWSPSTNTLRAAPSSLRRHDTR